MSFSSLIFDFEIGNEKAGDGPDQIGPAFPYIFL